MPENLRSYLEFATETAYLAGRLTLGYFQTGVLPEYKGDDTPVTIADKKAEEFIRGRIESTYPSHAILGEEFVNSLEWASHRGSIDPIDGATELIRGVPMY